MVYIREAHPQDGRRPDRQVKVDDPRTEAERTEVASQCQEGLELKMPLLIDNLDNSTEKAYSSHPDRLFLVAKGGKIAYRGDRGPWGFKAEELEKAIKKTLSKK